MRCAALSLPAVLLILAAGASCSRGPEKEKPQATPVAAPVDVRAEARRGIQEVASAVADARRRVASEETQAATASRERQLALSETRRAIVVANVALQKAREAFARGEFGAAREATRGIADRLRAVADGRTSTGGSLRPTPPTPPRGSLPPTR